MGDQLISEKLETMDKARQELLQAVNKLADETKELGQKWIDDSDGHKETAEEIGQRIDNVTKHLVSKCAEFSNLENSGGAAAESRIPTIQIEVEGGLGSGDSKKEDDPAKEDAKESCKSQ